MANISTLPLSVFHIHTSWRHFWFVLSFSNNSMKNWKLFTFNLKKKSPPYTNTNTHTNVLYYYYFRGENVSLFDLGLLWCDYTHSKNENENLPPGGAVLDDFLGAPTEKKGRVYMEDGRGGYEGKLKKKSIDEIREWERTPMHVWLHTHP